MRLPVGGWVQPKGMGYYKLSQWWIVADAHYTSTGEVDPNGTRATYFTSVFCRIWGNRSHNRRGVLALFLEGAWCMNRYPVPRAR